MINIIVQKTIDSLNKNNMAGFYVDSIAALHDILENCAVAIASTGHSKVMIGIKDINMLHSLRPNMDSLAKLSSEIGCNGYYVFIMKLMGKIPI